MNCFTRFLFKESFSYAQFQTKDFKIWAVVAAQMVEWSPATPEIRRSNPGIVKFHLLSTI